MRQQGIAEQGQRLRDLTLLFVVIRDSSRSPASTCLAEQEKNVFDEITISK